MANKKNKATPYKALGEKIKEARSSLKLNQDSFGARIITVDHEEGLSYQTISKYETGAACPDISTLKKISVVTGKPISWFFNEESTPMEIKTVADVIEILEKLSQAFQAIPEASIVSYGYEGTSNQRYELTFAIPFTYKKVFDQLQTLSEWHEKGMPKEARDAWLKSIMDEQSKVSIDDMFE